MGVECYRITFLFDGDRNAIIAGISINVEGFIWVGIFKKNLFSRFSLDSRKSMILLRTPDEFSMFLREIDDRLQYRTSIMDKIFIEVNKAKKLANLFNYSRSLQAKYRLNFIN